MLGFREFTESHSHFWKMLPILLCLNAGCEGDNGYSGYIILILELVAKNKGYCSKRLNCLVFREPVIYVCCV